MRKNERELLCVKCIKRLHKMEALNMRLYREKLKVGPPDQSGKTKSNTHGEKSKK